MSLNKVVLQGNLTRDIEVRFLASGSAVGQGSIAVNRKWRNKQTGEMEDEVSFIDLTFWGRTAEIASEYTQKGTNIIVEGRLKQDTWQDKETGANRSKIQVVVEQLHLQPRSQQGQSDSSPKASGGSQGGSDHLNQPADSFYTDSFTNDDIPF